MKRCTENEQMGGIIFLSCQSNYKPIGLKAMFTVFIMHMKNRFLANRENIFYAFDSTFNFGLGVN